MRPSPLVFCLTMLYYTDIDNSMRALTVLFGVISQEAFEPVLKGKSAFAIVLERAKTFPGSEKTVLLTMENAAFGGMDGVTVIQKPEWTVAELLKTLSEEAAGFDFVYYAWADTPFLDPVLAGKIAQRHIRFAAEYSYADGWPYGLGPELLTSAAAGILYKIAGNLGSCPVKRDSIFTVLQKDINSFDIETEISSVDLRYHRLSLSADSRRNLLLLERFADAGCSGAQDAERIIKEHPEYLRTLPAFFPIQVAASCPPAGGACALCPYPRFKQDTALNPAGENAVLSPELFAELLNKIGDFSGDAVIDLSLWGEIALHPQWDKLILAVLERPALSLVIETSGCGWDKSFSALENIAQKASAAPKRRNGLPALSWIVSLNPADLPAKETEAVHFVKKLMVLFSGEAEQQELVFVETVRTAGDEDAVEQFYRAWKNFNAGETNSPAVIIQKYDSFCGFLPQKQAVDLSPVERRPCWHIMRDFPVLLDGTVPLCREDLSGSCKTLGNIFKEDMETIWKRGEALYLSHCKREYAKPCAVCDEYYTYNF
jgi:spiro-SPASM protein